MKHQHLVWKSTKMSHFNFGIFHSKSSKYKCSSLRSQCWMRPFLNFKHCAPSLSEVYVKFIVYNHLQLRKVLKVVSPISYFLLGKKNPLLVFENTLSHEEGKVRLLEKEKWLIFFQRNEKMMMALSGHWSNPRLFSTPKN